jgi:hypothetical protein
MIDTAVPQEQAEDEPQQQDDVHDKNNSADGEELPAKLNVKNFLNIFAYAVNVLFTFGIGNAGWVGNGTNGELSEKYQTIITPRGTAFSIWGLIFMSQAIFCVVQLLPRYRGTRMVQNGVSYWWTAVCVTQVGWTFAFAFEVIPLSLFFMLCIWVSLMGLLYSQYYVEQSDIQNGSLLSWLAEFWCLRFPFCIHGGWITAALALNINVVVVNSGASGDVQLAVGIVSLAVLHAVSVWVLFNLGKQPNYTIACVLSWANGWIYSELQNPKDLILTTFTQQTINGVALAARAVAYIIFFQVIIRVILSGVQKYRDIKNTPSEEISEQTNEDVETKV